MNKVFEEKILLGEDSSGSVWVKKITCGGKDRYSISMLKTLSSGGFLQYVQNVNQKVWEKLSKESEELTMAE